MSFVYQNLDILLILNGVSLCWTPLPVGLGLIAIGSVLVVLSFDPARRWVRDGRPAIGALLALC